MEPRHSTQQPLALKMLESGHINQQEMSPIFAKLPKELREIVFEYALLAFADSHRLYSKTELFSRPEVTGYRRIAVELLLTCKAVYVETYQLPITLNPVIAYFGGPERIPPHARHGLQDLSKLNLWQFAAVHTLDITLQQVHLEGNSLSECARSLQSKRADLLYRIGAPEVCWPQLGIFEDSRRIDKLTIRLGRADWWTWEDVVVVGMTDLPDDDGHGQLALDPSLGSGWRRGPSCISRCTMLRETAKRRNGEWDRWPPHRRCWGAQIAEFEGLQELEFVLETFAYKADQLDVVVECAKLWKFPMGNGFELIWDGGVEKDQWIGVDGYGYEEKNIWLRQPRLHSQYMHSGEDWSEEEFGNVVRSANIASSAPIPDQRQFDIRTIRFRRARSPATS